MRFPFYVLHHRIDLPIFNISENNGIQWCYWPSSCVYVMVQVSCCNTEQRSPSNRTSIVSEHSDESEVWGFFSFFVGVQHWAACKHFFSCLYWYKNTPPWWISIPECLDFRGEWLYYLLDISFHGYLGMQLQYAIWRFPPERLAYFISSPQACFRNFWAVRWSFDMLMLTGLIFEDNEVIP